MFSFSPGVLHHTGNHSLLLLYHKKSIFPAHFFVQVEKHPCSTELQNFRCCQNCCQNFFAHQKQKRKSTETICFGAFYWRRVRDLNPGCAHHAHTISSRAPSTTQPTLHFFFQAAYRSDLDYYMTAPRKSQAFFMIFFHFFRRTPKGNAARQNCLPCCIAFLCLIDPASA